MISQVNLRLIYGSGYRSASGPLYFKSY